MIRILQALALMLGLQLSVAIGATAAAPSQGGTPGADARADFVAMPENGWRSSQSLYQLAHQSGDLAAIQRELTMSQLTVAYGLFERLNGRKPISVAELRNAGLLPYQAQDGPVQIWGLVDEADGASLEAGDCRVDLSDPAWISVRFFDPSGAPDTMALDTAGLATLLDYLAVQDDDALRAAGIVYLWKEMQSDLLRHYAGLNGTLPSSLSAAETALGWIWQAERQALPLDAVPAPDTAAVRVLLHPRTQDAVLMTNGPTAGDRIHLDINRVEGTVRIWPEGHEFPPLSVFQPTDCWVLATPIWP